MAPLVQAVAEMKGAPGDREGYQEEDQFDQEARQAQQRAGRDGGGRVESCCLVEPHLRGQHGCVPASQRRERVRQFQTHDAAHRERTRNAAPVRSRAAEVRRSRRGARWPRPRPASDQRSQRNKDLVPAQPSGLDELGDVHAGLLGSARAKFVEQLPFALQRDGDGRVETRSAEMAHRSGQQVGGHDPDGAARCIGPQPTSRAASPGGCRF